MKSRAILTKSLSGSNTPKDPNLCGSAESGIERIVVHWGSVTGSDPPISEQEAQLLLLKNPIARE
jgi:hypothetical protein